MLPIIVKVAQIAVGVAVGNVASEGFDKLIVNPIKKVVEAKKAESHN